MKTDYCPIIINEKYNLLPRVEPINNSYLTLRFYLENTLNKKLSATRLNTPILCFEHSIVEVKLNFKSKIFPVNVSLINSLEW